MRVGRICSKDVIAVEPEARLSRVCQLMRENHVGVVVVQEDGRPVGIVTDRDVALRAGGRREAIADVRAREVMSGQVMTVAPEDDICLALDRMREFGVRRLPVVNEGGFLAGVISLDDIAHHLGQLMRKLGEVIGAELAHEGRYESEDEAAAEP